MKILALMTLLAVASLHAEAWRLPPKSYNSIADNYAFMGDIDWSKRGNWLSPKYDFTSMADYDWGFRKRDDLAEEDEGDSLEEDDLDPMYKRNVDHRHNQMVSYRQRQPYNLARSSYLPYKPKVDLTPLAMASRGTEPQRNTRSRLGDRQYKFASMADLDWGWKKKRNVASLARDNLLPKHMARRFFIEPQEGLEELQSVETRSGVGALARGGSLRHTPH